MQNSQAQFGKGKEISTSSAAAPLLSDYMNYRQFLADFYTFKRKSSKGALRAYNYAVFSAAANIKSPNYLKMIIEGKRNLSDDMIGKFGKALSFMKEQTDEFRLLVHFTQATDPAERNMYLKKLSEHRVAGKLKSGEIDRKTWEKVPNWVTWIIYAMVDQDGVSFDTAALKQLLRGKASEDEIETALSTLLNSGELRRDEVTGELKKNRSLIESPEDIPVALVRKLQSQLMYLGLESLYQDQPTEREFGTLTMSLTKAEFEEIKFKLRQMRKGIHKDNSIARMKSKGERVYQLNIQLFPVTNSAGVSAQASAVMESALDLKPETELVETETPVVKPATPMAPAAEVVMQAAPAQPANVADGKDAKKNVSSLAANAASAADLFR
ncbi:hypothetical protein AZI86_05540 [Bdellovibrio bacteriovorus]|uniref:DUF4423 domain-containing protein n=1 Tax=Bdellovibrio bacteriovorus TaxID=959 RepID=A0A150WQD7_BDEBC|nr:TIGR02147 family protein [Bdellovibrio bacteriovorus]KYG66509.1 hypothetical protein AZI86_05540 [Bdellovibrio bacteriovorus]